MHNKIVKFIKQLRHPPQWRMTQQKSSRPIQISAMLT